jgi:LuxR family maltose regulon positive regulatory protein
LISAPAGFGKTTLIGDWINQTELPVAWLSLDEGDDDPVRFVRYLIAALSRVDVFDSAFIENLSSIVDAPQVPPIENILTMLINELARNPSRVALALDDYHLIDSDQIHEAITFLLDNLPTQLHLIIITRVDPEIPIIRLRARDELTELRAVDLRFTSSEAAMFLNQVMGLELRDAEISALETRTEGWITGLQMAALSMRGIEDVSGFVDSFTGSHRFILDYLIEEVLERQPENIQNFMIQTSILDRLSGGLCEALTGDPNSQDILEAIEQSNLFIVPLDNERIWFRYHHLFADLLQQRLKRTTPDEIPVLNQKASQWFEREDLIFEAISFSLKADDYNYATDLIEGQIEEIWGAGRHATIQRWISCIPEDLLSSKPRLSIIYAWYLFVNGQQLKAEAYLEHSEKAIESESTQLSDSERMKLRGRISAIRAFISNYQADLSGMFEYASLALSNLPQGDSTWRSLAVWVLGDFYVFNGEMDKAAQARLDALEISKNTNQHYLTLVSEMRRLETERLQGNLEWVLDRCNQLTGFIEEKGISKTVAAGWLSAVWGDVLTEIDNPQEGMDQILRGVDLGGRGNRDLSFFAWINLYYLRGLFSNDDLLTAKNVIQSVEKIFKEKDLPILAIRQLSAWKARISLKEGDLEAVSDWVAARGLQTNSEIQYFNEAEYAVFARLLMAKSENQKAVEISTRLLKLAEEAGRTFNVIEYSVMLALALESNGERSKAMSVLEHALSLAETGGFVRVFVNEGPQMAKLLYGAVSKDFRTDYIQKLLAAFPEVEEKSRQREMLETPEGEWIEPLSNRELEVLQLMGEGLTNPEIGERLFLSPHTVKAHARTIYSKLGVNNRTLAVNRAKALGLLSDL